MQFSDYIVYADESGDATLGSADRDYPVFVLAFCMFKKTDYISRAVPAMQQLKFRFFGHDDVVLHEHEIRRKERPFVFLADSERQKAFMGELEQIMLDIPFEIVAAIVDKRAESARTGTDPYESALYSCLRRTTALLASRGQGQRLTHLIAESRGKKEDTEVRAAFDRFASAEMRQTSRIELRFAHKRTNSTGLQVTDLIARPIGLSHLRPQQPNRAWDVIEQKIRGNSAGDCLTSRIEVVSQTAKDLGQ